MSRRPKADPKSKEIAKRHGLTAKEAALAEAYLTCHSKATAWVMAGYDPTQKYTSAYTVFKRPGLQAYLRERIEQKHMETDVALAILSEQAAATLEPFTQVITGINPLTGKEVEVFTLNMVQAKKMGLMHMVKEFKEGQYGMEIKLIDSQNAIKILGTMAGWIKEKGPDSTPPNNDGAMEDAVDMRAAATK